MFFLNSQFNPDIEISEKLFHDVCMKGHLEVAKWLFELNPNIDISEKLFQSVCEEVSQWLNTCKTTCPICCTDLVNEEFKKIENNK